MTFRGLSKVANCTRISKQSAIDVKSRKRALQNELPKMSRKEKQPQCKCPQTTARQIRTIPLKTRDHENDKWGLGEYRLWATALERGHHSSYQEPPDYPVFSNTSKKRTKSASELTQALTEVASVFLKSSRSDVSSHAEQASADKATYNRTELLKQMQMLSELYQSGALSKEEFEEQKKNVLRDISKC
ncbi:uncharacterized protein [Montipora capricornis]|uniref:uncharacterized protein n=1 Tax=Montipora capricornis TaxID=246305 RepID=UPI0035F1B4B9